MNRQLNGIPLSMRLTYWSQRIDSLRGMLCSAVWCCLVSSLEKVSQVGCCQAQTDAHRVTMSRAGCQDQGALSCLTCGMLHSFSKWTHQRTCHPHS
ncbi:hypothetical protein AOLI_G00024930 [Acnodon oligacanthus]